MFIRNGIEKSHEDAWGSTDWMQEMQWKVWKWKNTFEDHTIVKHSNVLSSSCGECNYKCSLQTQMKVHMKEHVARKM